MISRIELRPGYSISRVIKGGWQLAGGHGEVDRSRAIADMTAFVDAGITTFDCADIYTGVEEMIGGFLSDLQNTRGVEAVRDVQIHTKLVPDEAMLRRLCATDIEAIIDRSLLRLGVGRFGMDRLDLVQFHWWDYAVPGAVEALAQLDALRRTGKVRHIGVTNFDVDHLAGLLASGVDIIAAQVQYSLLDQRPAGAFADLCREHDIAILAYGTLAGGFLSDSWLDAPDPGMAFDNRSLTKYRLIIEEAGGWAYFQRLLAVLADIGRHRGVAIAEIATAATLQNDDVAAVILGARYARHLETILHSEKLVLGEEERNAIAEVIGHAKGPLGPVFGLERDTSGRHGRILKKNLNVEPV